MSHHSTKNASNDDKKSSTDRQRKKITIRSLLKKKQNGTPITMLTAYDYATALLVDQAEIDMILVGDSLGNVVLGRDQTTSVTMDEMVHHCKAVMQGTTYSFVVGDMPYLSYHVSPQDAIRNAGRLLKETSVDAVKLEGGRPQAETIRALTDAGIPVVGHIGLTPQTLSAQSGFRVQGRTAASAHDLYLDALALQAAGCIGIVFELVPELVASEISQRLKIPTIGIGAGAGCDGQVLVFHDMTGLLQTIQPRFLKKFGNVADVILSALTAYRDEVTDRSYPAPEHTYKISEEAFADFLTKIETKIE